MNFTAKEEDCGDNQSQGTLPPEHPEANLTPMQNLMLERKILQSFSTAIRGTLRNIELQQDSKFFRMQQALQAARPDMNRVIPKTRQMAGAAIDVPKIDLQPIIAKAAPETRGAVSDVPRFRMHLQSVLPKATPSDAARASPRLQSKVTRPRDRKDQSTQLVEYYLKLRDASTNTEPNRHEGFLGDSGVCALCGGVRRRNYCVDRFKLDGEFPGGLKTFRMLAIVNQKKGDKAMVRCMNGRSLVYIYT